MLLGNRTSTFVWRLSSAFLLLYAPGGSGCRAIHRAARPSAAVSGSDGVADPLAPKVFFQADVAPVTALAWDRPFLWVGSDRGLRRFRFPGGEAEWVGPQPGLSGRRVSALTTDHAGRLLIATEAGVFRRATDGQGPRFLAIGKLPSGTVTHLAPLAAEGGGDGVWVGTSSGLLLVEGGKTSAIDATGKAAITSLDLDADGKSVWAGAHGLGLFYVRGRKVDAAFGPGGGDGMDLVDSIGTALLPNGTRIAIGRGADGRTRAVLLRLGAPVLLTADPDLSVSALITGSDGPLLLGGTSSSTRVLALRLAERGQLIGEDCVRFTPARKSLQELRLVACPEPSGAPEEVTVAATNGDDVFVGTRAVGVARLADRFPDYLATGEIALGARSMSVVCQERSACILATGTGSGWRWDAHSRGVKPMAELSGAGVLMAVAGDGRGAVYFVTGDGKKTIQIARGQNGGDHPVPLIAVPVEVEGVPIVTFATVSPDGSLWLAVRDRVASGQEFGRGVIEVQLGAGRTIHHRPYREAERRPPDALPIVGDVRAVRFQRDSGSDGGPPAMWFCTSMGVVRFAGGDIRRWGENEGLESERCTDIEIVADGTIWIATEAGPAHFDGKSWHAWEGLRPSQSLRSPSPGSLSTATAAAPRQRPMSRWPQNRDGEPVAARALVVFNGGLWAGTPRGIWPLTVVGAPFDRASGLIDDDVMDLEVDRFGRLWTLGKLGLTMRDMSR